MGTQVDRALNVLHEWVQSESLRKHCYAVADSMRHFAPEQAGDPELWEAVGLLTTWITSGIRTRTKAQWMVTLLWAWHG